MTLVHYSAAPFVLNRTHAYPPTHRFKPTGLWVSVEGDDADETWPAWCEANEFHLEALAHRTEIILVPDAPVRRLATTAEIRRFTEEFLAPNTLSPLETIDWGRVQARYGGLMIAPYQCSVRLDFLWYYGWDCASACIWDLALIRDAALRGADAPSP